VYNPGSEHLLEAGDSLIVLADSEDIAALRQTVAG
jgi:K+/H+ antiporter YhaU regulatory subunit KhtT